MPNNSKFNLVSFFFPPFSEKELVSLFYLLFLFAIHRWKFLLSFDVNSWELVFVGVATASVALMIFINVVSARNASHTEKAIFSYSFYILLSIITIYALVAPNSNYYNNSGSAILEILEIFIILYLFLKSFIRLVLITYADDLIQEGLGSNMQNDKLKTTELVLIILFAPVIYLLLQANNSTSQVLCLSYFYLSTLITVSENLTRKYIIPR